MAMNGNGKLGHKHHVKRKRREGHRMEEQHDAGPCDFNSPEATGVVQGIEGLAHFHLCHSGNTPGVSTFVDRERGINIHVIDDPELRAKVLSVIAAECDVETAVSVH